MGSIGWIDIGADGAHRLVKNLRYLRDVIAARHSIFT
jgi:hypothetical protein